MKKGIHLFTLLFLFGTFTACDEEQLISCTSAPNAVTIMPLGDSRVEGGGSEYASYRFELWKNLANHPLSFDFIGSRYDDHNYTLGENECFDRDHEGTGGAVTADNLETVNQLTSANIPQVVLLGIGGNDLTDGGLSADEAIDNINQIIDKLQSLNDGVIIFLEQIAPGTSDFMTSEFTAKINEFNGKILTVASNQTSGNSKVIAINMAENWSDDYMADPVHYNNTGAKVIADRYYQAILEHVK